MSYYKDENQLQILLQFKRDEVKELHKENARLREALESISKNTCCKPCQEAKKVALQALKGSEE
jgi:hypothetical protein